MTYKEKLADGTTRITGYAAPAYTPLDSWPVGSIYISMGVANPSTFFGGTWTQFAQGQMLIGQNSVDADFNLAGKTGGEKTHTLVSSEMPDHSHGSGSYQVAGRNQPGTSGGSVRGAAAQADSDIGVTGSSGFSGGGNAHNNMPPYITVYMWRRTA